MIKSWDKNVREAAEQKEKLSEPTRPCTLKSHISILPVKNTVDIFRYQIKWVSAQGTLGFIHFI